MPFSDLLKLMLSLWWIVLPPLLYVFFKTFWMMYANTMFLSSIKWVLLEIKIPREVVKTPKSAEQIFVGIQGTQTAGNLIDRIIKGRVQEWFSFEIVGRDGFVYFYVHTQVQFKNLIEANIYAQYSEAEITEAQDYAADFNVEGLGKDFDLWGTELSLIKQDAYPIRTYSYFDYDPATDVERAIDPLSSLTEIMSSLKPGEQVWFQVLVMPVDDSWKKGGEALVQTLMGRKAKARGSILGSLASAFGYFLQALSAPPQAAKSDGKEEKTSLLHLSPGEQEVVKSIENNISKLGFATRIRFVYIAKKDVFTKPRVSAIFGAIKQFNSLNLNGFKPDNKTKTKIDYFMIQRRETYRKRIILHNYKNRNFTPNPFVLNTEELATVYHFPGVSVSAPTMPRVEAKRGTPPPTLPTVE